jgi:ankyrin repeat protein
LFDRLDIAQLLVQRGVDINLVDHENTTPLVIASVRRNVKVAQYLMKLGADVNAANCYEETALMRAAGYNNI